MKVAVLSHRYPYPPDRGDRSTLFHFLKAAAGRHSISLLALCDQPPGAEAESALRRLGVDAQAVPNPRLHSLARTALALPGRGPLQRAYFRSAALERAARALGERHGTFDCLVLHSIRMLPLAQAVPARRRVLMAMDCLTLLLRRTAPFVSGPMRWLLHEEARRVERAERACTGMVDEVWLVSESDARAFPAAHPEKLRVVRHGVAAGPGPAAPRRPDGRTLLFVGRLDVRHNVAAAIRLCREVLPRVQASWPQARVRLVGSSPCAAVRAMGRLPGVEVVGPVLRVQDEYATAAALVAPLAFSTGVQNKILEAGAAGLPVVTTPDPAEAMGPEVEAGLWIGESDESLALAVCSILAQPQAAAQRAQRVRRAVLKDFQWDNLVTALEQPLARGSAAAAAGADA